RVPPRLAYEMWASRNRKSPGDTTEPVPQNPKRVPKGRPKLAEQKSPGRCPKLAQEKSPKGTLENSPGRSPGLTAQPEKSPAGTTEASLGKEFRRTPENSPG